MVVVWGGELVGGMADGGLYRILFREWGVKVRCSGFIVALNGGFRYWERNCWWWGIATGSIDITWKCINKRNLYSDFQEDIFSKIDLS